MRSPGLRSDARALAEIHGTPIWPLLGLVGLSGPGHPTSRASPPPPRLHLHPQDIAKETRGLEAVSHFEHEVQSSTSSHSETHRQEAARAGRDVTGPRRRASVTHARREGRWRRG